MRNFTVMQLIQWAYNLPERDIVGMTGWARNHAFDVEARVLGGPATTTQLRAMLQNLLSDRFGLDAIYERRTGPVYALELNRRDGKLGRAMHVPASTCKRVPPEGVVPAPRKTGVLVSEYCGVSIAANAGIVIFVGGMRATAADIAHALSPHLDRPVVDRTGLTEEFDFILEGMTPGLDTSATGTPTGGEIFTAIREQLGLKLQPDTGEFEVLVIRSVSAPTEN